MNYYVKKTLSLILTFLFIAVISFILFQIIPGDSAVTKLGINATPEQVEALREARGLNDPVIVRFGNWLGGALRGDFGESSQYGIPVASLVLERFCVTLGLGIAAILLIVIIAIPLGLLVTRREGTMVERIITFLSHIFMAIPSFYMGMLVTLLFGIVLRFFTPGGYTPLSEGLFPYLGYIVFPAFSIALPKIAITVKFIKNSMNREKSQDYVRTALAKGADEKRVVKKHIFRNSLMPIITFIGLLTAEVLAGSIMVEQVFNVPGLGRLLVSAIANRDFAVVQAILLCIAFVVLFVNFVVDILYRVLDPRI